MNTRIVPSEKGASAVEYGLIVAAIAGLIIVLVFALGLQSEALFKDTCDSMNAHYPPGTSSCS